MNQARGARSDVVVGLSLFTGSSAVVGLGVLLGLSFFKTTLGPDRPTADTWAEFCRFDGQHYKAIAVDGYDYDPHQRSEVAFFPLYPLLARGVMSLCGCAPEVALLLISNAALALALVLFHGYVRLRHPEPASSVPLFATTAVAFFPPTMFFHMAYAESVLLCLMLLTLIGAARNWPPLALAVIVGLATATRPVGVALVPVFAFYLWRQSPNARSFWLRLAYLGPLSCWGLIAYMLYQWVAFGDPLAFAKTQQHWTVYPDSGVGDRIISLLTLEPVWGAYGPSSPRYWGSLESAHEPVYSLMFWNPLVFIFVAGTAIWGGVTRTLNAQEFVLAAGLLLIPYVTRAYDTSMFSMARFSAAVVPCYLVWGFLGSALPRAIALAILAVGSHFVGAFAAMFAAGYRYF